MHLIRTALLVTSLFLWMATALRAATPQELAAESLRQAEPHRLAAGFNLNGGYRVENGSSVFTPPVYKEQDTVTLQGTTDTVLGWMDTADALRATARRLYNGGDYVAARELAARVQGIYAGLNDQAGRPIAFWRLAPITQRIYPEDAGVATIAYEDYYPSPGDADYNDFLANLRVTESYNQDGQLVQIDLEFVPRARGAAYDHQLMMTFDGQVHSPSKITAQSTPVLDGDATIRVRRYDAAGAKIATTTFSKDQNVVIFPSTRQALPQPPGYNLTNTWWGTKLIKPRMTAQVEVVIGHPESNLLSKREGPAIPNYRPILHVKNTNEDVDVWDVFRSKSGLDRKGYPFGIVVPKDWRWPMESVRLDDAYPFFAEYRDYVRGLSPLTPRAERWYEFPSQAAEEIGWIFDPALFEP
jgi:LruC domain-containing protein